MRSPLTGVANARVLLRVWHDLLLLVVLRVSRRTQSPQLGEIPGPGFCDSGYASAQNDEGQVGLRDAERRDAQNDEARLGLRDAEYPALGEVFDHPIDRGGQRAHVVGINSGEGADS